MKEINEILKELRNDLSKANKANDENTVSLIKQQIERIAREYPESNAVTPLRKI